MAGLAELIAQLGGQGMSRPDGTQKGNGYFGVLRRPDGQASTELSFDFDADGRRILAPLLVPTLSRKDIDLLLSGGDPTPEIYKKAQEFALDRLKAGKPAFAIPGELFTLPR